MSIVTTSIQCYLAVLLGVSGIAKARQPKAFATTLRNQRIIPSKIIVFSARIIPLLEIAISILLVTGFCPLWTSVAAVIMFFSFLVVKIILLTTKRYKDCGCYGSTTGEQVDYSSIIVSLILLALALFCLWGVLHFPPPLFLRIIATSLYSIGSIWLFSGYLKQYFGQHASSRM